MASHMTTSGPSAWTGVSNSPTRETRSAQLENVLRHTNRIHQPDLDNSSNPVGNTRSVHPPSPPSAENETRSETPSEPTETTVRIPINKAVHVTEKQLRRKPRPNSSGLRWNQKLGKTAIWVIILGNVLIMICMALLAFLWFSNNTNTAWRAIVVRNWIPQAVTIISEVLKIAVGLQIGTCSAMLAALAIERFEVELQSAAPIALIRANVLGSGSILDFAQNPRWLWRMIQSWKSSLPLLIVPFVLVFGFLQAITIILISDLDLEPLPAKGSVLSTPYSLKWSSDGDGSQPQINIIDRSTTWLRKPQIYPAFAEYTQSPFVADGVDDTGPNLRAFLPLAAAADRERLHEYFGRTTVVDTRVTCQVPDIFDAVVQGSSTMLTLNGSISATKITPRLGNFTAVISDTPNADGKFTYAYNVPVPFTCTGGSEGEDVQNLSKAAGQWRTSLCQLGETSTVASGGLVSEFRDPANIPKQGQSNTILGVGSEELGTAYLLFNVSIGDSVKWDAVTGNGAAPPAISQHGPWRDLVYSNADLVLSVSLCYSGFDAADIPVRITSTQNRSEPFPTFDQPRGTYKFDRIRQQFGQYRDVNTTTQRGILDLKPDRDEWLAQGDELSPREPYIRRFVNMYTGKIAATGVGNTPNMTTVLWQSSECLTLSSQRICPDPMYMWLFQDIVKTGGSVAFALQSLLTLLSSLAYYDQLAQFDMVDQSRQTFYVTTNTAQTYAGFIAVAAVIAVHVVLATIVLCMFLAQTKFSMLGNTWQAVGQLVSTKTVDFFDMATASKDSEIEEHLKSNGIARRRVGVGRRQEDGCIGLLES